MALSRILSPSLPRSSLAHPTALLTAHRHRSTKSHRAQLVEIDAEQPDSPEATAEVIAFGIRKLEDAIHSIIVRRAAPDWLPFLPGYSYWVPPRASSSSPFNTDQPAGTMMEVIGKLASSDMVMYRGPAADVLSDDEQKAFSSSKGWPSSAFYLQETSPVHPIPVVKLEMKIQDKDEQVKSRSDSEDEEG
ncbi:uncharacterized protein LOC131021325 [Salvia miltiorrhiza]|uniref:uncharacterized protein LOC131021325 n=1 Tax=Salvia miltiorrhiza TaxID=226208 RepID=UPI0025ABD003|nr:uncharacterized protein LOC131021325 [Salvia miltiorrhiza]